jgi:hypothetical protein
MHPFDTTFLAQERISELIRRSADIHRDREGAGIASRMAGALSGRLSRSVKRIEAVAAGIAAAIGSSRPARRT